MSEENDLSEAAKMLGRQGGLKGGRARAEKLTPEERSNIARKAVTARWSKINSAEKTPVAKYGSLDHPLKIGGIEIPCYVLDDGRRVLIQTGMIDALNMSKGGAGGGEGDRLAKFVSGKAINSFANKDLTERITSPVLFKTQGGSLAYGYEATILADICEAVLAARKANVLQKQQLHIAEQCEILVRGFARVGIIALVDEATGYQDHRSRQALEEILDAFISKELRKWAKTFPDEFYREMFRLQGWQYSAVSTFRPVRAAQLTNDIVYDRLAPGVLDELKRIIPKDAKGRRKQHYHRRLTEDVGHPRLREHMTAIIALMKISRDWDDFYWKVEMAFPKFNETGMLNLSDSIEDGQAKAIEPPR